MSRANSYSSSVSTLTINAFCSYSTASCVRNSNPKAIHEFAGPKNQIVLWQKLLLLRKFKKVQEF
jgi:hypothetical protein